MKLTIKRRVFNDAYLPYVKDYSHRYEVYYGGAGSGKSVFIAQKLVIKAMTSKRKILVVRKVATTLRDSCFQLLQDTLERFHILNMCKVTSTNMNIVLPNGSIFLLKGLDDGEKIKSIVDVTDAWVEEATEIESDEYDQLDLRIRANVPDSQLIVSFNPISKANWVYGRWFERENTKADTVIIKTTYKDNRFLPQSYVDSLESMITTNRAYYNIYALGDFASLDKLIYNNWSIEPVDVNAIKGDLCIGLDFGFVKDPSALVASMVTDDTIYVFDEWGATDYTNDMLARVIRDRGYAKSTIICDSAEDKSITELKQHGIVRAKGCVKGPDSIMNGIKKVREYRIVVDPRCTALIEELQNYSWAKDRKTGEYIEKPIDLFNHYLDALRYSLQCITRQQKPKFYPKAYLGL